MKSKMIYIIGLILCLILTIILYIGGEVSIALFTLFGVLIFSVLLIKNNNLNKSPESQYLGTGIVKDKLLKRDIVITK